MASSLKNHRAYWERQTISKYNQASQNKEQQEEIRKPSSAINAKKQRKITEWERLEISSRKLEIPREHFMQKMGTIKDRNGLDLTEAEDIKKRWQEYTEELYKKDLHNQIIRKV